MELVEAEFADEQARDGVFFRADLVEMFEEPAGLVLRDLVLEVYDLFLFGQRFYLMFLHQFNHLCRIPHAQPRLQLPLFLIILQLLFSINPPLIGKPPHLPQPNPSIHPVRIPCLDHLIMPLNVLHPFHCLF